MRESDAQEIKQSDPVRYFEMGMSGGCGWYFEVEDGWLGPFDCETSARRAVSEYSTWELQQ